MNKTVVLIENGMPAKPLEIAKHVISLGYSCTIIANIDYDIPDGAEHSYTLIRVKNFTIKKIRQVIQDLKNKQEIVALSSVYSFFFKDGLLAAEVSHIAKELGLRYTPSEAIHRACNKFLMRRCFTKNNVYTIRYAMADSIKSLIHACNHVKFPAILKPYSGCGSSFIYKCNNIAEAEAAFKHYISHVNDCYYAYLFGPHTFEDISFDPAKDILVEEFIDGPELSVEILCTETEVIPLLVHDKLDVEQANYCTFENLLVTPPVRISKEMVEKTKQYVVECIKALGFKNCFCHVELRIQNGQPSIIEVNPRIGGMRVKDSIKNRLGIIYKDVMARLLLGEELSLPDISISNTYNDYLGMCAIYPRESGLLSNVHGIEEAKNIKGIKHISQHVATGEIVGGDFEETFVVTAWFKGQSEDEIRYIYKQIKDLVILEVKSR